MSKASLPSLWFINIHPEVVSKLSDEDHAAGELEKAVVEIDPPFMANEQASPVASPGEEPLDLPAMPVAAQHQTILQ